MLVKYQILSKRGCKKQMESYLCKNYTAVFCLFDEVQALSGWETVWIV